MIDTAVILMAGLGSRLRAGEQRIAKPLIQLLGRPLVSYTLEALARAGIKNVYAVVGFEKESLVPQVEPLAPATVTLRFIDNPEYRKQNGISVLAAAKHVNAPFLLTMADHLFEQSIVDLVLHAPVADGVNLAVDRKIDTIFDIADAMKVQTRDDRIVAIGKELRDYDAIDTGMFACAPTLFDYLEAAKRGGDCSLADGVRAMAAANKARVIDIGDAWWQDVDTPAMLAAAEKRLRQRGDVATAAATPERRDSAED
jgi:choline kinase